MFTSVLPQKKDPRFVWGGGSEGNSKKYWNIFLVLHDRALVHGKYAPEFNHNKVKE